MTMNEKLSLEGLIFQATKIDIDSNVLTITLNRPEKKNALVAYRNHHEKVWGRPMCSLGALLLN